MHGWWDVFFIIFGIWGVAGIIDARVDKRLRAAGVIAPTPTPPKPPSVFLSPRLALIGSAVGVIGLLGVVSHW